MRPSSRRLLILAPLSLILAFISTGVSLAGWDEATQAQVGAETEPPQGYYDFCMEHLSDCDNEDRTPDEIKLTRANQQLIDRINTDVNSKINQTTDVKQYGAIEYWSYPQSGKGDCEDISLLKRRLLINEGLPRQALLLTMVQLAKGGQHVVLTIKSTQGDYIADNLQDEIKPWNATPYQFIKRQSQYQQNVWQEILPTPKTDRISSNLKGKQLAAVQKRTTQKLVRIEKEEKASPQKIAGLEQALKHLRPQVSPCGAFGSLEPQRQFARE